MAEASLPPLENQTVEAASRKRSASEALDKDGDHKKIAQDPMEEYVLGQYPYNVKRTCILHDHSGDKDDPLGHKCAEFETEFGTYDSNIFIDQNEAEDLLATLECLAGKLAQDTQPLSLEWNPSQPPPLALDYEYPPMLGWCQDSDIKSNQCESTREAQSPSEGVMSEEKSR